MDDLIELLKAAARHSCGFAPNNIPHTLEWKAAAELARLTAEVERYRSAIRWALGHDEGEPEFRERRDGDKPYYWRTELARRAGAGVRDIKEAGNG